jgi:hypothetical protein
MNTHYKTYTGIALAAGSIGFVLSACAQGAEPEPSESTVSASAALSAVQTCQGQAFGCAADAQAPSALTACNQDLGACLISLLPDAGPLPVPTLPAAPTLDAGFPRPTLPDAGLPMLPTAPPVLPSLDAGLLPPPPPALPALDAGALSQASCFSALQQCLTSGTAPTTCGTQAQTCLAAVVQSQCDAQQQACISANLPQAFCKAQRAVCQ